MEPPGGLLYRAKLMDKREKIINHLKDFLKNHAHHYKIEMAFLYGSWARGYPRPDSDIDIALVFSEALSSDEVFERINDISLSLSSRLDIEVNIIEIHKDFRKPMLYYNAIVSGIPVYIEDSTKYIRLQNEAIYQMEDYCIFGIDWQHEVTRKNLEAMRNA